MGKQFCVGTSTYLKTWGWREARGVLECLHTVTGALSCFTVSPFSGQDQELYFYLAGHGRFPESFSGL